MTRTTQMTRFRRSFSKIPRIAEIPNLINIQKESYERFLQMYVQPEDRLNEGLQAVFNSVYPIKGFNETASLEFVTGQVLHVGLKPRRQGGGATCRKSCED